MHVNVHVIIFPNNSLKSEIICNHCILAFAHYLPLLLEKEKKDLSEKKCAKHQGLIWHSLPSFSQRKLVSSSRIYISLLSGTPLYVPIAVNL